MIEPDYYKSTNKAYEIINKFGYYSIPISVFKLIQLFQNIKLYSYSDAAFKQSITYNDFYEIAPSEFGFSMIDNNTDNCIIFYNDKKMESVIRFTLAHELGHCLLHHLKDGKIESMEANCFARNLLCPIYVVLELGLTDIYEYMELFNVSKSMAEVSIKFKNADYINITEENYYKSAAKTFNLKQHNTHTYYK